MFDKLTDVVKNLLIINVLVYLASLTFDLSFLRLYPFESEHFMPIQLVTHFFMHSTNGITHIFFNMFALYMFGPPLERIWGPKRFLFYYICCAFGAVLLHAGINSWEFHQMQEAIDQFSQSPTVNTFEQFIDHVNLKNYKSELGVWLDEQLQNSADWTTYSVSEITQTFVQLRENEVNIPTVGASGAIFGLLIGFGMLFPNVELMMIFLPIPIKAKYFIPLMMLLELFLGVQSFSFDNIAHFAHLGGAIMGFIIMKYWASQGRLR